MKHRTRAQMFQVLKTMFLLVLIKQFLTKPLLQKNSRLFMDKLNKYRTQEKIGQENFRKKILFPRSKTKVKETHQV